MWAKWIPINPHSHPHPIETKNCSGLRIKLRFWDSHWLHTDISLSECLREELESAVNFMNILSSKICRCTSQYLIHLLTRNPGIKIKKSNRRCYVHTKRVIFELKLAMANMMIKRKQRWWDFLIVITWTDVFVCNSEEKKVTLYSKNWEYFVGSQQTGEWTWFIWLSIQLYFC
jgi:hypothetical protein